MKALCFVCISSILISSSALAQSNPVPLINMPLVPPSIAPGGPTFTLTVNGTGFVPGSVINWNGTALVTTFVKGSQLTAGVPASEIMSAGTAAVAVTNPPPGGGKSNIEYLNIFAPQAQLNFTTYNVPYPAISMGDFNADNRIDLVSGNCIVLGIGDGGFKSPLCNASNFGVYGQLVADFSGDGKLDLASLDNNSNTVGIFLGNGDGTLEGPSGLTFPVGQLSGGQMKAADFNRDGKLDLAVPTADGLSILLGNGDGSFQPQIVYPLTPSNPFISFIVVGDFDRDGNLDVAYATLLSLYLFRGNGDGTFQPASLVFTPGIGILGLAVADLNGDGILDLVVTADSNAIPLLRHSCFVLLGKGDGTFQPAVEYAIGGVNPADPTIVDVNTDGKLDVAVATSNEFFFALLLGNGDGSLQTAINIATQGQPSAILAGDFNGDGKPDLVTNFGSLQSAQVFLQGSFPIATFSPEVLTFTQQAIGTSSPPQNVTLTNTGLDVLTLPSIGIIGANAGDFAQTNTCFSSLAVNASCQISVIFTPGGAGNRSASVSATDNAPGNPQTMSLTGVTPPTPLVNLSPVTIAFPVQYVGTTGLPQNVKLTSTGSADVTITNASTSPADFGVLNACGSSVPPGTSCSIGVFFKPTAIGTRTGTLTVTDNTSNSPHTVSLSGTGQDFSVAAAGSSSATVSPGQTASYTVSVVPAGGFNQNVALSCSGAPSLSTCSLSSSSVVLNGSTSSSVTVTVTTQGSSASLAQLGLRPSTVERLAFWLPLSGLSGLWLVGIWGGPLRKRRSRLLYVIALLCLLSIGVTMPGCGGSSGSGNTGGGGTPAGTYNLTVTGSFTTGSSRLSHAAKLTLVVQ